MRIVVPRLLTDKLSQELKSARRREIGGVLVAEHLGDDQFRLADLSVQRDGGASHHFIRDPAQHRAFLADFFDRSGHDYTRYNYLGEWHSHPNVTALPSATDINSMQEIVNDSAVGTPFAVLLIARRRAWWGLELSATVFHPSDRPRAATLLADQHERHLAEFREVMPRARRRLIAV